MIYTYNQVPEVYYKESRDFQLIGRLYDIVFNYLKTNIDTIYHLPLDKCTDKNLLDLLSATLGFEIRHNYDINQLYAICSCFSTIMKNKGTLKAIKTALDALLNSQGINKEAKVVINKETPYTISIYIPSKLVDITLLEDLLDYIMPAGMSYTIINSINIEPEEGKYATYVRSGLDQYSKEIYSETSRQESGKNPINYVPQYNSSIQDYTNYTGPGTIDNVTVTDTRPQDGESGE